MTDQEYTEALNKADKHVHPVETQWHYPILTKYGYKANTKEGIGLSRSYTYQHPIQPPVKVTTGINGDYWESEDRGKYSYWWSGLELYLKNKFDK